MGCGAWRMGPRGPDVAPWGREPGPDGRMYRDGRAPAHGANMGRTGHEKGAAKPDRPLQFPTMARLVTEEIIEDRHNDAHKHHDNGEQDEFDGHR